MSEPFSILGMDQRLEKVLNDAKELQISLIQSPKLYAELATSHIEAGYKDYLAELEKDVNFKLNKFHCDLLLNGTLDLLRRCVAERSSFDALREAWQDRFLELTEATRAYETAKYEYEARLNLFGAESRINEILFHASVDSSNRCKEKINTFKGQDQWSAAKAKEYGGAAGQTQSHGLLAEHQVQRERDSTDLSSAYSEALSQESTPGETRQAAISRLYQDLRSFDSNQAKEVFRQRVETLVDMMKLRQDSFTKSGAPHNYADQLEPIRNRFLRDLAEAGNRLRVIEEGLRAVYGLNVTCPSVDDCANNNVRVLDAYLAFAQNCVRDINNLVVSERRLTVTTYVPFSEFGPVPNNEGLIQANFEFHPIANVGTHARVRGASAYLSNPISEGVLTVGLRAPASGQFTYRNDLHPSRGLVAARTTFNRGAVRIHADNARPWLLVASDREEGLLIAEEDQSSMGTLWLGRVASRDRLEAERQQNGELWNASPFPGSAIEKWTVLVSKTLSTGHAASDLPGGIELDIDIAFLEV